MGFIAPIIGAFAAAAPAIAAGVSIASALDEPDTPGAGGAPGRSNAQVQEAARLARRRRAGARGRASTVLGGGGAAAGGGTIARKTLLGE